MKTMIIMNKNWTGDHCKQCSQEDKDKEAKKKKEAQKQKKKYKKSEKAKKKSKTELWILDSANMNVKYTSMNGKRL